MLQIYSASASKDLTSSIAIALDGTTTNIVNTLAYTRNLRIFVQFGTLTAGSVVSWKIQIGPGVATAKTIENLSGNFTVVAGDVTPRWWSPEIPLLDAGGTNDTLIIEFESTGAETATIQAIVYDMDNINLSGEVVNLTSNYPAVDVKQIIGTAPTLTDSNIDVNVETGNGQPLMGTADVNAEVDNALDTAIPGSPTADSINQRLAAIDDLVQAAGAGDLAAVTKINICDWYLDTGQDPYEIVYHVSGDTDTELFRKKCYESDGTAINTPAQIPLIGKVVAV